MHPRDTMILRHPLGLHLTVPLALAMLVLSAASSVFAAEDGPIFERDIVPLLKERCTRCHGGEARKAELDLTSPAGIRRGGESGAILSPGKPDESRLYELIHDRQMPPEGQGRLSDEQIALVGRWIEAGAPLGDDPSTSAPTQHDVIPIFLLRCTVCHGARRQEGGLDLRTKESMLRGGASGPAIVAGHPDESLLVKRIQAGEMPPRRRVVEVSIKPPEQDEIEKIARWIAAGAPETDAAVTEEADAPDEDRQFWSFQPPLAATPPGVAAADRVRTPVDAFLLSRLEAVGLSLSPEADRRTLIRRATFDLTGLPPTAEDVDTFLADERPDAYEHLIDRLLASPHYGERWGRYWLDLAGYSDSEGVQHSDPVRVNNWRYRDYVIRSFNTDKPYDRFLLEQLAGDELTDIDREPVTAEVVENLTATGFLRQVPDGTFSSITAFVPDRLDVISSELEVLSSSVLGLTFKCARCHSHKFDPISQRDYYRLAAIFKGALDEHDWLKPTPSGDGMHSPFEVRDLPRVEPSERQRWEQLEQVINAEIATGQDALRRQAEPLRAKLRGERLAALPEAIRTDVQQALDAPAEQRGEVQKFLAEKFGPQFALPDDELAKLDTEFKTVFEQSATAVKAAQARRQPQPAIRALWDRGQPSPTYVLRRGDYRTPGDPVEPGVPAVFSHPQSPYEVAPPWPGAHSSGRRLAYARWLTQPDHPLTARVLVNRVWRHHFGRGIVTTLDNFGKAGAAPSHPELLDWLAVEFVRHGWSIKTLHRLLMTSSVYRQSSAVSQEHERLDPDNRLWSRMPLRRLEAEALRDTLLAVSGALDRAAGGPADGVDARPDGLVSERGTRRSVYLLQRRTQTATFLETFDLPRMGPNCIDRSESNVAPQALLLLNNRRIRELADEFANRVAAEAGDDPRHQIKHAYRLALVRSPSDDELRLTLETLTRLTNEWSQRPADARGGVSAERKALGNICHALLNSAELVYVD